MSVISAGRRWIEIITIFWNLMSCSVVDGKIMLNWIFRKWNVRAWTGSIWLRIGTGGGHL